MPVASGTSVCARGEGGGGSYPSVLIFILFVKTVFTIRFISFCKTSVCVVNCLELGSGGCVVRVLVGMPACAHPQMSIARALARPTSSWGNTWNLMRGCYNTISRQAFCRPSSRSPHRHRAPPQAVRHQNISVSPSQSGGRKCLHGLS